MQQRNPGEAFYLLCVNAIQYIGIYLQDGLDNAFSNIYFPVISRERAIKTYFLVDKQKPLLANELPLWQTRFGSGW